MGSSRLTYEGLCHRLGQVSLAAIWLNSLSIRAIRLPA